VRRFYPVSPVDAARATLRSVSSAQKSPDTDASPAVPSPVAVAGALAVVALVVVVGVPCPLFALTGLSCPGCGTTRALRALLHGDVMAAFAWNPLTMTAMALGAAWWLLRRVARVPPLPPPAQVLVVVALSVAAVAFGVARNR
jgi:hypothetical protein